jgi:hypothetical protein
MTTLINADTSGGLKLTSDTSGALDIQSAGSTKLSMDSSGNLSCVGNLSYNGGYGSAVPAYGCRAWIKLTGQGTVAIAASANVASITDRGTGTYTVTFTDAMPDANYSTQVTTTWATGVTEHVTGLVYNDAPYAQATGSVTAKTYNFTNAGAAVDATVVMVAVFR